MLYPEVKFRHLEFKSSVPAFSQLIKTCVAFANGAGGKIIIGVEDKLVNSGVLKRTGKGPSVRYFLVRE